MAPLSQERIERAYHEAHRYPSILEPEMVPLIDIMLDHTMVRSEITITRDGLEYRQHPIDFQQSNIWRQAYEQCRPNEPPVYVVAPFSLKTELTSGNSKDWFSWRLSYPVQNGDATVFWNAKQYRLDTVEIIYSLFAKTTPSAIRHPENRGYGYVDENGRLGYVESREPARFGAVFAGCELVAVRSGFKIPHQVLVFG